METYPTLTFRSAGIRADGESHVIDGELTLHGVTKSVPLAVEINGFGPDAHGGYRAGFSATTVINRNDFGVDIKDADGRWRSRRRRQDQHSRGDRSGPGSAAGLISFATTLPSETRSPCV